MEVFAYADDLTLISEILEGLQAGLDTAGSVTTLTERGFNPRRFATLCIDGNQHEDLTT